jgi:hypothetical protein
MNNHRTSLERAFELASSGSCASVDHVRKRLKAEGYDVGQITGPSLVKQLREMCATSRIE